MKETMTYRVHIITYTYHIYAKQMYYNAYKLHIDYIYVIYNILLSIIMAIYMKNILLSVIYVIHAKYISHRIIVCNHYVTCMFFFTWEWPWP